MLDDSELTRSFVYGTETQKRYRSFDAGFRGKAKGALVGTAAGGRG